ncbi:MAG: bacillithiol system redox-active protein YtxJ [Flavobacterium sp.]|nr:bacillithiol system redox-active protein YtxJ [Flavobacterium sp.]
MSMFSSLFGSSENQEDKTTRINWIPLVDLGQLNEIILLSSEKPVVIFKHSTRCSVSRMALKQFESEFDLEDQVTPYFLDLLEHRDISNAVAERFDVVHQSPQLLLIKNGMSVYDASHSAIEVAELRMKI